MKAFSVPLFDTHCHMDRFAETVTTEFSQAKKAGISYFVVPSCGQFNWDLIELISQQEQGVYYSLGMHPYFMDKHAESHLSQLEEKLATTSAKCVAIGECGLDFYHSRENEAFQCLLLSEQIKLANKYQQPLILHARKAHQDMIKLLKHNKSAYGGVIHGFSGSVQQAMDYIKLGFYIGVGGIITYPRAQKTRRAISQLPLTSLVLETDAPDMPIFGHQGEKNHPKNIEMILKALILLRSEPEQTIASQVLDNSKKLFGIC